MSKERPTSIDNANSHEADASPAAVERGAASYQTRPCNSGLEHSDELTHDATVEVERRIGPSFVAATSNASERRYRVVRSLARGGLGEVFVARDLELPRDVVVKEIHSQHLDDGAIVERFVFEAEITGSLEHPGIVPIYGFGHYADGRPYYAMRFVRGETLGERVRRFHASKPHGEWQRSVEFRELLHRFVAVCQAIEFAHRRGVLHRDLKPANIMLGEFGETLVVDWGLAKRIGISADFAVANAVSNESSAGTGATATGSILGTPSYMSPEQAAGDLNLVGVPADIYGLGATLYFILTARPPVSDESVMDTIERVRLGAIPTPRSCNPYAPLALQAICLKAMAIRPEQRYPSAHEIAVDVNRWLADEPVSALVEPWLERAGRWIRRHRTIVTSLSLSLGLFAATATVAAVLLNSSRKVAEENSRRARAAEEKAEERFRLARQAVDDSFTAISESPIWLGETPGAQGLRKRLLEKAKGYYESFAGERSNNPEVLRDAAGAHARLGRLMADLSPDEAHLGSYEKAKSLWLQLKSRRPNDSELAIQLASTERALGRGHLLHGRTAEAWAAFSAALSYATEAMGNARTINQAAYESAAAGLGLAQIQTNRGELAEALATLEAARSRLAANASNEATQSAPWLRLAADLESRLGYVLQQMDRLVEAAQAYANAVANTAKALDAVPGNVELSAELAARLMSQAQLSRYRGETDQALDLARKAAEILARLAKENPQVTRFPHALAKANAFMAFVIMVKGSFSDAHDRLQKAELQYRALIADHPTVVEYRADMGGLFNTIAEFHARQGRIDEAIANYDRAIDEYARIFSVQPRHLPAERSLNYVHMNRATWLLQAGRGEQALAYFERRLGVAGLSDFERGVCRHWRAYVWAHGKEHRRALAEVLELARRPTVNAEQAYNLACVLAVAAGQAAKDSALRPNDRRSAEDKAAAAAIELLQRARDMGFFAMPEGFGDLRKDPDLNPLRNRDDFKKLLASVAAPNKVK